MRGLRLLLLRGNALTGPLPETLGTMRSLVALDVGKNRLTGSLPRTLSELVNLQVCLAEKHAVLRAAFLGSFSLESCERFVNGSSFARFSGQVLSVADNKMGGPIQCLDPLVGPLAKLRCAKSLWIAVVLTRP